MREPVVEVFAEGESPQERAVGPEGLRIGRLRENDVVLGGRAVSRRHAALRRDGDRIVLEDAGSENGSYVNGARVERRVALQAGDELRIGAHRIVLREGFRRGASDAAAAAPASESAAEATDGAEARAAEEAATLAPRGAGPAEKSGAEGAPAAPERDALAPGDRSHGPASARSGGDEEPELWLDAPADEAGLDVNAEDFDVTPEEAGGSGFAPEPAPGDDAEADFPAPGAPSEKAAEAEPGVRLGPERSPEPEPPPAPAPEPSPGPSDAAHGPGPDGLYAGFVVQREGQLDGVVSWEGEVLVAGRGAECEIVLDRPEVSRRHASFVRENGAYVVYDAGSANGTRVNGEPVERRALELGDVVEIDRFALTFLLDAQPIESVVQPASLPSAPAEGGVEETRFADAGELDALGSEEAADPFSGAADAMAAEEGAAFAPEAGPVPGAEEEEKELEALPGDVERALPALEPAAEAAASARREVSAGPAAAAAPLRLELALDVEALPEALREALRAIGDGRLRVPVELRVRNDAGDESQEPTGA